MDATEAATGFGFLFFYAAVAVIAVVAVSSVEKTITAVGLFFCFFSAVAATVSAADANPLFVKTAPSFSGLFFIFVFFV